MTPRVNRNVLSQKYRTVDKTLGSDDGSVSERYPSVRFADQHGRRGEETVHTEAHVLRLRYGRLDVILPGSRPSVALAVFYVKVRHPLHFFLLSGDVFGVGPLQIREGGGAEEEWRVGRTRYSGDGEERHHSLCLSEVMRSAVFKMKRLGGEGATRA
mmetsp:Transcript_9360/g.20738  ORF Transcript_9360/g.20738 Transcript_9360/m.20738 type:complete len:157 (+) Transcript_9360:706-1176(+)